VERSADNNSFSRIGSMPAAGEAQYRTDYLFTDPNPLHGANYYRLKQVDRNGAYSLTQSVAAIMGMAGKTPVIFPNPATDVLNVAFASPVDGASGVSVEDALGRTMATIQASGLRGTQTTEVPIAGLARGWYSLRITLPNGTVLQGGGFIKR
ncbi:MAG: T9SS type A sorting domain-containing protein, partial [Bacteroidetes bacterium]|nr:T9SS type A sorting domain-containing protein [Bacteroidota bacterium]